MSQERIPSVQQLTMLRARLVQFQLHCEAAGLWPGAVPSSRRPGFAAGAALDYLRLCLVMGALLRSALNTSHMRQKGKGAIGAWSDFWFSTIRGACYALSDDLADLGQC